MRVKNGGHNIPTDDILRKNTTSFRHLYEYATMIDNLILIDNSKDDGELILEINNGVITFEATDLPKWVGPVVNQFKDDQF
jgi:predicted ABC-type ATPase